MCELKILAQRGLFGYLNPTFVSYLPLSGEKIYQQLEPELHDLGVSVILDFFKD